MKKLLTALLVSSLLCSGFADPDVFRRDGITFVIPADWTITQQDAYPGDAGYYLVCERSGAEASGVMTLWWENAEREKEPLLATYMNTLREEYTKQNLSPVVQPSRPATYGPFSGLRRDYTFRWLGGVNRGTVYCLSGCGKTLLLLRQEAVKDMALNKPGFDKLSATLRCAK